MPTTKRISRQHLCSMFISARIYATLAAKERHSGNPTRHCILLDAGRADCRDGGEREQEWRRLSTVSLDEHRLVLYACLSAVLVIIPCEWTGITERSFWWGTHTHTLVSSAYLPQMWRRCDVIESEREREREIGRRRYTLTAGRATVDAAVAAATGSQLMWWRYRADNNIARHLTSTH